MPKLPGSGLSPADEIAKLAELRDTGILSEKEFQDQKRALLAANRTGLHLRTGSILTPTRIMAIGVAVALVVAAVLFRPGSPAPKPIEISNAAVGAPVKATALEIGAVTWAITTMTQDKSGYYYQCLSFVTDAYQHAGLNIRPLSDYYNATGNWDVVPEPIWNYRGTAGFNRGTTGGPNTTPPYGALVFFTVPPQSPQWLIKDSHVMIMGAGGFMISTADTYNESYIHTETLAEANASRAYAKYSGWWLPDGSYAPPPPPASQPTSVPSILPSQSTPSASPHSSSTTATPPGAPPGSQPSAQPTTETTTQPTPQSTATSTPPPATYPETAGGLAHTWTDYLNAGGYEGPSVAAYQTVQIACKVTGMAVADGNTWWYRIAQSPWSSSYYVSADAFYNNGATSGSLTGTPFVDPRVPNC